MASRSLPDRPTLADLITYARGDGTYFDLEERMPLVKDPKSGLLKPSPGYKALSKWVNEPLPNFPALDTLKNLSVGLDFSVGRIILACCESMKIPMPSPRGPAWLNLLPEGSDDLPSEAVEMIVRAARLGIQAKRG